MNRLLSLYNLAIAGFIILVCSVPLAYTNLQWLTTACFNFGLLLAVASSVTFLVQARQGKRAYGSPRQRWVVWGVLVLSAALLLAWLIVDGN